RITFVSPTPENTIYVGRNHPLVEGLAEYLFDLAFRPPDNSLPVARCGVIRTSQVSTRTVLLLLRSRYLVRERGDAYARLAEEILVRGYVDERGTPRWLTVSESYSLLETATPTANVPKDEKREILAGILEDWKGLSASLKQLLAARAHELEQSHRRMRKLIEEKAVKFQPNHPPDWLGVLVLLPEPKGVAR
ncbi:MAG: helicase, partial [Methanobacteriota archaeon]